MKINVSAELTKITPETASEWLLEKWGEQRPVRKNHVNRLASDMMSGNFRIASDAILRIKGKLANGQHRLEAVVQSGKPQTFLVMESNDEELYKVIDDGLRRSISDSLIGVTYAKELPPTAFWIMAYEAGTARQSARSASESAAGTNNKYRTRTEMIDYCNEHLDKLIEAVVFTRALWAKTKLLQLSMGSAIYTIASDAGKEAKVKDFLQQVYVDGGQTSAGDLRNRLIANQTSRAKLNKGYIFGITVKALKSFLNGSRPGVLKWSDDESLPTI